MKLADVKLAFEAAVTSAERRTAQPISIVLIDNGGHLVSMFRQDGAAPFSIEMAQAKARAALWMGGSSGKLASLLDSRIDIATALATVPSQPLALIAGGLRVKVAARVTFDGAVGVAGDAPEVDELIASDLVAAMAAPAT